MLRYRFALRYATLVALISLKAWALATPETLQKKLLLAFGQNPSKPVQQTRIIEKSYVGFVTKTVLFGVGQRTYRVVFSSDGSVAVSVTQEGDLAAQPIWSGKRDVSVEQIVNMLYTREYGKSYDFARIGQRQHSNAPDNEAKTVTGSLPNGSDLSWDRLMNRVLHGDLPSPAKSGGSDAFAQSVALAKSMDPCAESRGQLNPLREAITSIASTLASMSLPDLTPRAPQLLADRSRDYEKHRSDSFLDELGAKQQDLRSQEVFRLIRESGSDMNELFRAALREAPSDEKDPYALAALRNFRSVARASGEEKGKRIVAQVLNQTVVDVEAFNQLREGMPKTPVIYERKSGQYFVDPTLTSPAEARYGLSVAVYYAWRLEQKEAISLIEQYDELQKKISRLEYAILDEKDDRDLANYRANAATLSKKLLGLAEEFRKAPLGPAL